MLTHERLDGLELLRIGEVANEVALHTCHKLTKFTSETLFSLF